MSEYAEKFGMREPNFQIEPSKDSQVFFGKEELANRLVESIKRRLMVGRTVKAVFYGDLGVGKTQLLHHLAYRLGENVHPIYIKCPAFHRRTTYVSGLHSVIASKLGFDFIFQLIGRAIGGLMTEPVGLSLRNRELERVIREGWVRDRDALRKFLGGARLTASEMKAIGAIHPQISEDEAVGFLDAVAELVRRIHGKKLLLLIDEFENTNVLRGDPLTMFTEAIREMCEEGSTVDVIFAATHRSVEENRILSNPTVKSRIGHMNYFEIEEYTEDEMRDLVQKVIEYKRSPNFDVGAAISKLATKTDERLSIRWFPFTEEAVNELIEGLKLLKDDGIIPALKPREALNIMDTALAIAVENKKDFIDSAAVRDAVKPR